VHTTFMIKMCVMRKLRAFFKEEGGALDSCFCDLLDNTTPSQDKAGSILLEIPFSEDTKEYCKHGTERRWI